MPVVPVVDDFKEVSVGQEDADVRNSEIKMKLCVTDC